MTLPTAAISPYPELNTALAGFLTLRGWPVVVVAVEAGFAEMDSDRIKGQFSSVIILARDLINQRVLDIGCIWGQSLASKLRVFLIDFEEENDFTTNPVILNTMRGGLDRLAGWTWKDLPLRTAPIGNGSFAASLRGLFRTHGHEGFLGELAKLSTYLLAGIDFAQEVHDDRLARAEYLEPSIVYLENVLSLHRFYANLLACWPDKVLVGRINEAVKIMSGWGDALKAHDLTIIGPYTGVAELLSRLEHDVVQLMQMMER